MFIAVTRLQLRGFWSFFPFTYHAFRVDWQTRSAAGNLFVKTRHLGFFTICTLTGWETEAAMRSFRDSDAHLEAMRVSRRLAVFLQSSHFEGDSKPDWKEAFQRMEADPRSVKYDGRNEPAGA